MRVSTIKKQPIARLTYCLSKCQTAIAKVENYDCPTKELSTFLSDAQTIPSLPEKRPIDVSVTFVVAKFLAVAEES